jgi:hypothetical protein
MGQATANFLVPGAGPAECSDRYTNNSPICPGLETRDNHKKRLFFRERIVVARYLVV